VDLVNAPVHSLLQSRLTNMQAHLHHYVPQWYQKRFLQSGQTEVLQ